MPASAWDKCEWNRSIDREEVCSLFSSISGRKVGQGMQCGKGKGMHCVGARQVWAKKGEGREEGMESREKGSLPVSLPKMPVGSLPVREGRQGMAGKRLRSGQILCAGVVEREETSCPSGPVSLKMFTQGAKKSVFFLLCMKEREREEMRMYVCVGYKGKERGGSRSLCCFEVWEYVLSCTIPCIKHAKMPLHPHIKHVAHKEKIRRRQHRDEMQ